VKDPVCSADTSLSRGRVLSRPFGDFFGEAEARLKINAFLYNAA
jgi:hypothetical protein